MKKDRSYTYLILTILFWSATPAVAKLALDELNNFQLLFYSSIIGVISLFLIALFQGKLKTLFEYTKQDYLKMFGMGFLGVYIYYIFLFGSFALAPAGQANVINYLWPIFIIVFSIPILREKFNYKTILAVLISFIGALVVFTGGNLSNFNNQYSLGYLLAVFAAICYGLFSVLGKKLHYEKLVSMFVYYVAASILIVPTVLIYSEVIIPKSITTIISVLLLGGLFNSMAFVFWFKALKTGHTHKTANSIYVVPFLALILTYIFNDEPIRIASLIGLVLIITGIFTQFKNRT
ncbi:MAG: DMT family transporter [Planctomycetota bacterium]|jgi:drug/metabolite transporter (DMT)-like permease